MAEAIDRAETGRSIEAVLMLGFVDCEHPRPALVAVESDFRPGLAGRRRSPQNREHQMGDPVALDADRRVAEQDVF